MDHALHTTEARRHSIRFLRLLALIATLAPAASRAGGEVDFNRDIRPILASNCFTCHGPDTATRKAGLRLDTSTGATADLDGTRAITPGDPARSELIRRITAADPSDRMPPQATGKLVTAEQVRLLSRWIAEGAPYAQHWSYSTPVRSHLPEVRDRAWPRNAVDRFILARLDREGMSPSQEAERHALVRRVFIDLTGLPPTLEEVDDFAADPAPDAYERLVDHLLAKPGYGEHWARMWLDLARYADSAGYADDPPRTIWAYRDHVIDSFNSNKPFDRFTLEQIAGDLLPEPSEDALVATAFHRNTQTNNEGGTNDEEFRNVAVVDRVNTTLAVWMGATVACAQCHNHKYDPITQEEYFRLFAFFNSTEDADRTDEQPVLPLYSEAEKLRRAEIDSEAARLGAVLSTTTPELSASQARWEEMLAAGLSWDVLAPATLESKNGAPWKALEDGSILVEPGQKTDVYRVLAPLPPGKLSAIRLEALPDPGLPGGGPGHSAGNFVITRVTASLVPPESLMASGRYVRVDLPGKDRILSLAEVQVLSRGENLAAGGEARQSSTSFEGPARLAIDGNTDGRYNEARSTTHTANSEDPWWELDLKADRSIDQIVIWNRVDNGLQSRLGGFRLSLLDGERRTVWEGTSAEPPNPTAAFLVSGVRDIPLGAAHADHAQKGFEAESVLGKKGKAGEGWAVGGETGKPHALTLLPAAPEEVAPGFKLSLTIEQMSKHESHTLGRLRVASSRDPRAAELAIIPERIISIARTPAESRTDAGRADLVQFYLMNVAPELREERQRLAIVKKEIADRKPTTTVPVLRELSPERRRKTLLQHRGNYLDVGKEVSEGVPGALHPLPEGLPPNRLALARWLTDEQNPLTARVIANRYWEKLLGSGIVLTSEDFGVQGDLPSHPELLDWLATELTASGWDLKALLRLLVTSATYRQSSRVSPDLLERDPDNRLLARGPRLRLPAEEIRDQALFVSGLLSLKMHGPPVRPPQPSLGLSAAFGGGIDWQTSDGEDRYRRGLYTTWRRSSPYPSMTAFDAPTREVCTVRRDRTNTPLQALVTLNDPVYVEAAQALARRMAGAGRTTEEMASHGFRLVLARPPREEELERLLDLYRDTRERLAGEPEKALSLATVPLGPVAQGADPVDLAAWTVVGNVLLNLDETLMKR